MVTTVTMVTACLIRFLTAASVWRGDRPSRWARRGRGEERYSRKRGKQGLLGGGANHTSTGIAPAAGVKGINQTE